MKPVIKFQIVPAILLFMVYTFLISCEEDITVDLPTPEPKIVIEGYITPGAAHIAPG